MLEDEGMTVDMERFTACREEQRVRAREARKALGDLGWAGIDFGSEVTATEFVGYTEFNCQAKVVAVCIGEEVTGSIAGGENGVIVLDKTPFYAEMGGKAADHGVLMMGETRFEVTDVQKDKGGRYLHTGTLTRGALKVDDVVCAAIDVERRKAIMRAHTATHLLQKALKAVLGDHVHQAGSLVEPDRLRFDFTHYSALTPEELAKIDTMVQDASLEGYGVDIRECPLRKQRRWALWRCSAKSTAIPSVLLIWAITLLSFAAVRTWTIRQRSAPSALKAKEASLPVSAESKPLPARPALRKWSRTGRIYTLPVHR